MKSPCKLVARMIFYDLRELALVTARLARHSLIPQRLQHSALGRLAKTTYRMGSTTMPRPSVKKISIFISSPRDVLDERVLARDIIQRLADRFRYHCQLEPAMWEWEPIRATGTFPDVLPKPSDSDIVVVILWSRLGYDLPDEERFRGPDGQRLTGTEWEFLDALQAAQSSDGRRPDLLVFRKKARPVIEYENDEQLEEFKEQNLRVNQFFTRYFQDSTGSFIGALREFEGIEDFEKTLEESLIRLVQSLIESEIGQEVSGGDQWISEGRGSPFRGLL